MSDLTAIQDPSAVSAKSSKKEILSAYQDLLNDFQKKSENVREKKESKQAVEQESVKKASVYSVENILEAISNLDSNIRKSLRELGEQLIGESQKLNDLQDAIRIETENLEKIKKIKVEIDTLEGLIEAQKLQKAQFEEEIAKDEENFSNSMQAKKETWRREQEEYEYELSIRRKKEENEYEERRAVRENELANREKAVKLAEQELFELRQKAERSKAELDQAVSKAKEEVEREVRKDEQIKMDLFMEKHDGERRIASLTIETLKEKTLGLESEVTALKEQLALATREVKEVAVKVIEGHSRTEEAKRYSKLLSEKADRPEA